MSKFYKLPIFASILVIAFVFAFSTSLVLGQAAGASGRKSGGSTTNQTTSSTETLTTPLLVVTVRAQGSNRYGHLYWSDAEPSVSFDVFRNEKRIATVRGSTTGNNFYTDSVGRLRGTFTYQVRYARTDKGSNSVTVVYDSSTETIRYAPECPTTGTAKCIVTLK